MGRRAFVIEKSYPLNHSGFTLIEVLIAMVVFTIGMLAITYMQGISAKGCADSSSFTWATTIAQQKLEDIIAEGYGSNFITENYSNETELFQVDSDGDGIPAVYLTSSGTVSTDPDEIVNGPRIDEGTLDTNEALVTSSDIAGLPHNFIYFYRVSNEFPLPNMCTVVVHVYWYETAPDINGRGEIRHVKASTILSKWD